jgi:hypothetical protein
VAHTTFPRLIDDVTCEWLSEALGATVHSFTAEPIGVGVGILGALHRLHLHCESGPSSVVVKLSSPFPENRAFAAGYTLYEKEVRFYNEAAQQVPVRTPHCWFAAIDDAREWSCIVMEDLGDGRSPDQIAGVQLSEAEAVIDALAGLHATYWDRPELDAMRWLPRLDAPQFLAAQDNARDLFGVFEERYGAAVGDEHLRLVHRLLPHIAHILRTWARSGPETIAHCDMRGDNLIFLGPPNMSNLVVLDWQLSTRSRGAYDVGYFLVCSLTLRDRRAHEHELIERYVDALARHGVHGYTTQRCLADIREWMLILVSTAPAVAAADPGNERGRILLEQMLSRAADAAADHDIASLIPSS